MEHFLEVPSATPEEPELVYVEDGFQNNLPESRTGWKQWLPARLQDYVLHSE